MAFSFMASSTYQSTIASDQLTLVDHCGILSEPRIPMMLPPVIEYPLASLIECMRLILFIFIVTVSMTMSQLATSTFGLFMDIVSNFDEHFLRLVPVVFT